MLDAVMEESRRQARTLGEMRTALERGDDSKALEKARDICGLTESEQHNEKTLP
jgi:hypothetical protein